MKVIHVISGIGREGGGPSRSSQGLVAELCNAGIDAWIWPLNGTKPWISGFRQAELSIGDDSIVELKGFDLTHIHGIWDVKLYKKTAMCCKPSVQFGGDV